MSLQDKCYEVADEMLLHMPIQYILDTYGTMDLNTAFWLIHRDVSSMPERMIEDLYRRIQDNDV